MRLGLVYPRFKYPSGDPPLGVLYLAAAAKAVPGTSVKFFDATFAQDFEGFSQKLLAEPFDIMGFSVMTSLSVQAFELARRVKARYPETKIISGGPHATVMPLDCMKEPAVDAAVVGEGEATLQTIIRHHGIFDSIPGVTFRNQNTIITNPPSSDFPELDDIVLPDWSLLDMPVYSKRWFQLDAVSPNLRGTHILATRGCPYHCTYCQPTLEKLFGRRLRKRSASNIVEELTLLKTIYGINSFIFADDTFTVDKNWVKQVCSAMVEAKLNLVWGCNVRANTVDEDTLDAMKEAGLRKIFMGIESANQDILDNAYCKGITLDQVKNATAIAHKLKLKVQGYFMMGAPGETLSDIRRTIRLAYTLPIHDATFSITTPLPGTTLFDKTRESISIEASQMDYYKSYAYGDKFALTRKQLARYRFLAFALFYSRPFRLWGVFRQLLSPAGIGKLLLKLKRL